MSRWHSSIYFLLFIFAVSCISKTSKSEPKAINGVLDLRNWEFKKDGVVSLNGEWEFYWEEFLSHDDFQKTKNSDVPIHQKLSYIQVPGVWNGHLVKETNTNKEISLNGVGYSTYRLRVLTNDVHKLTMKLLSYSNPYRLYINGELLGGAGEVGKNAADSIPIISSRLFSLPNSSTEIEILLHVSNFHYYRAGIWKVAKIGLERDIQIQREKGLFSDIFISGSLLIMGFYHFGLFLLRKKDRSTFFFGTYCVLISLNSLTNGELYFFQMFPDIPFELGVKLDYLTFFLTPPIFILFLSRIFAEDIRSNFVNIIVYSSCFLYAIVLLFPARISSHTTQPMQIVILFVCVYTIYIFIQATKNKREAAKIFLAGSIIFSAIILNDILEDNQIIHTGHYTPGGLLIFILSQSFILSMRSARAFANSENLAVDLEKNNLELTELKNSLEIKVIERTRELEREKKIAEDARQKLAEADREKTSFFQNISHELRTPLTLIAGPVESARRRKEPLDEATMDMVVGNTKRLQRLVNQLLDLQKVTAGKMELNLIPINISVFLKRIYSSFEPYALSRGIALEMHFDENLPNVHADVDKLDKCIYNYLSNALKFTPENGRIAICAKPMDSMVCVEVCDSGIGIPDEKISGLFTKFGFSEASLTRDQEGTGLGLSLVKELIEMHGGQVGVKSQVGGGSNFWFTIPSAPVDSKPVDLSFGDSNFSDSVELAGLPTSKIVPSDKRNKPSKNLRILIVEDNVELRIYMSDIFHREGYETLSAENGEEGILKAFAESPEIIITDLMMPKLSGADMIKKIRANKILKSIPIVLLTAKADIDTRLDVRKAGADCYLSKPFNDLELLSAVRNLLSLKERENILVQEIEKARIIQQNLLPKELPLRSGIEFSTIYLPMDLVGGDLYDFVEFPDGRIGIFIADVSGHGMPAAMIASIVKVILSMLGPEISSPNELLNRMNEQLFGKTSNNFLTAWYGILDPSGRNLKYALAGHPFPILIRNGISEYLTGKGPALAIMEVRTSPNYEKQIIPGDRLFFYTDGITEVLNSDGELFGEDRLIDSFLSGHTEPLGFQLNNALMAAREFRGERSVEDDVTLVGLAIN